MTSEPIAVLFVLQTQDKGYPDNREEKEEEQREERERRRGGGRRENIQPPTDVGEKIFQNWEFPSSTINVI